MWDNIAKIYVVGPVGSGKSTLSRKLANDYNLVCCELDSVVYEPDPLSSSGNKKRSIADRDARLQAVLANSRWIVEDAGRDYFEIAMQKADSIIQLEPSIRVRKRRILFRWIKQNLHMEKCGYIPDLEMLKRMYQWTRNYDIGADGVKERLAQYASKITIVRTKSDIRRYIKKNLG